MTKVLHLVRVYYDVMVVAESMSEYAIDVARSNITDILENERPEYDYIQYVSTLNETHPWYRSIPYGKADGKSCHYYTIEEINERKNVVKKVQAMLTPEEWEALTSQLGVNSNVL